MIPKSSSFRASSSRAIPRASLSRAIQQLLYFTHQHSSIQQLLFTYQVIPKSSLSRALQQLLRFTHQHSIVLGDSTTPLLHTLAHQHSSIQQLLFTHQVIPKSLLSRTIQQLLLFTHQVVLKSSSSWAIQQLLFTHQAILKSTHQAIR